MKQRNIFENLVMNFSIDPEELAGIIKGRRTETEGCSDKTGNSGRGICMPAGIWMR